MIPRPDQYDTATDFWLAVDDYNNEMEAQYQGECDRADDDWKERGEDAS